MPHLSQVLINYVTRVSVLSAIIAALTGCGGGENNATPPKNSQIISALALPNPFTVGQTHTLAAKSNSGLTIAYNSKTADVCSVIDAQVKALKAGLCTVEASQAGDDKTLPATIITVSQAVTEPKIAGQVADGYLIGAKVFWDCNSNQAWDSTEAFAITGTDGKFEITAKSCDLVVYVPSTAIDQDTGISVGRSYTMLTPKGGEAFISPLTTLVQARSIELRQPSMTIDEARQKALAEIQSATGLSNLNANYLDTNTKLSDAAKAHNTAKILAQIYQDPVNFPLGKANAIIKNIQSIASQIPNVNRGLSDLQPLYANINYDNSIRAKSRVKLKDSAKEGLTLTQIQALQSVVDNADVRKSAFDSQIYWANLTQVQRKALLKILKDALIVPKNTELLALYREQQKQGIYEVQAVFEEKMNNLNQVISGDIGENLSFIKDTLLASANMSIKTAVLLTPALSAVDNPDLALMQGFINNLDGTSFVDSIAVANDAVNILKEVQTGKLKKLNAQQMAKLVRFSADALAIVSKNISDRAKLTTLFGSSVNDADATNKLENILSGFELLGGMTQNAALKNSASLLKSYLEVYNREQEYAKAVDKQTFAKQQPIKVDFDRWIKAILNVFDDNHLNVLVSDYVEFLPAGTCADGTWAGGNTSCLPLNGSYSITTNHSMPLLGETISFRLDAAVNYVKSVVWKVGDVIVKTLNSITEVFTHIFQTVGEFVVSSTLQNQSGQEVARASITVNTELPLIASLDGTVTTTFVGQNVNVIWSNSRAKNDAKLCGFSINFGNGLETSGSVDCHKVEQVLEKTPQVTQYTKAGQYTIALTVKDSKGRTANTTWIIDVKPLVCTNGQVEQNGKCITPSTTNLVSILEDDFNDGKDDFSKWLFEYQGSRGVIAHTETNGYLEIRMDKTDVGTGVRSMQFMPQRHIRIEMRHFMQQGSSDRYWSSLGLGRNDNKLAIGISWHKSSHEPDNVCSPYNKPKLSYRIEGSVGDYVFTDPEIGQSYASFCLDKNTTLTSSDYFGRWITTVMDFDHNTGVIAVDFDNDGVTEMVGTIPEANRALIEHIDINTFGQQTGHLHRIDYIKVWGDNPNPTWTTNLANGHQYAVVDCGTWTQCQEKAISLGAHLVTIKDAIEQSWIRESFADKYYWLGITDQDIEGKWQWITGENISYQNWSPSQPDNHQGDQDYAYLGGSLTGSDGKWDEVNDANTLLKAKTYGLFERSSTLANIAIKTDGQIKELTTTTYMAPYQIRVTDGTGAPVANTEVKILVWPVNYYKGSYIFNEANKRWQPVYSAKCSNEDANQNGFLDVWEDNGTGIPLTPFDYPIGEETNVEDNKDGKLWPANPVSLSQSIVRTDQNGIASFNVLYGQSYANWLRVKLTAKANVLGKESKTDRVFDLSASTTDMNDEKVAPPGGIQSLYGIANLCTNPN